jgi:hypothetical protein
MSAKHCPLPWSIDGPYDNSVDVEAADGAWVAEVFDAKVADGYGNAEFIVRACNSHYELLEALRDLLRDTGLNARDAALAAIAKATGTALLLLLCALPASAQEVRLVYPAFVTARVLDLTSTHQALKAGATEINPLMKHPALRYALHPLMTVGFVAAAEKARAQGKGKRAFWLMVAGTAGQLALDYSNYRQAANLRRGK